MSGRIVASLAVLAWCAGVLVAPPPPGRFVLEELRVPVHSGRTTLAIAILRPRGDGPFGAVILNHGVPFTERALVANLVDNALRYAPAHTAVTVSLREVSDAIELAVEDAGPGIPPEQRERVLRRFQRIEGDLTAGIALGLPIAKAIVERHRGSMVLSEARWDGSRPAFRCKFAFQRRSRRGPPSPPRLAA